MKVIFMGTPDFAVNTLEKIIEAGHEVMLVVTQPDKPKGRGKKMVFPVVKEKALDNEISGSFSFKNVGASADLSFGKNSSGSGSSTENGVTELSMAIETVGGSPAYPIFTIPQKLEDVNIDLSQWMASLTDKTTHSIVDIADEGLVPISEFIL